MHYTLYIKLWVCHKLLLTATSLSHVLQILSMQALFLSINWLGGIADLYDLDKRSVSEAYVDGFQRHKLLSL